MPQDDAERVVPGKSTTTKTARRGTHRIRHSYGLSGSGKTHAIRALEDLGYFCVDNLPVLLIPTLAELAAREDAGLQKVAIVADIREADSSRSFRGCTASCARPPSSRS